MATSNNQLQAQQKPKFSVAITTKGYQSLISNTLRDPARARRFTASITSAVAVNPALQECDAGTILAGALLGESLNLSPSPQLGQYYLVPFKQKAKYDRNNRLIRPEITTATFVLGYKGYVQLALRSGQYADLDVMEIKEGEYLGKDSLTGKAKFQFIEDDDQRDALPTVGYMAYFEYLNGFRKVLYWSKEKMMNHADTYSKAFSRQKYEELQAGKVPESEMWKYSSFWYKNFDDMVRLPRGRKEQQYRIAGDRAAKIAWQVYAKAVIDVLHYGPDRLERLRKESRANYEQLNKWGHEDGMDVAMEKLRRCAAEAMQAPELEVSDIDGSKDAAEVDKEFRKQQLNFIKRVRAQTLGRIGVTSQPVNVLAHQNVQDKIQLVMQQVSEQSFERRRVR